MRALCWYGTEDVRVENVPDPTILNPGDAIVRVTATAICGSDLHLYDGYIPTMQKGDILGHEFMGEVVEVGPEVRRLAVGDRVVVPFTISCGRCWFCRHELYSQCDNTNPNAWLAERFWGHSPAGIYGYSHIVGGYAGGQAEYARVPFADVGPIKVPRGLTDEQVLFLSDILPTGWMGAENCDIRPGDVVAVWGCGPVGQFAILSALMLGAERVLAIDRVPERLALAARRPGVETIDQSECDVVDELRYRTGGRGPDACIDAVGLEAHGKGLLGALDKAKQTVRIQSDRPFVLREAIQAVRKGGTVSIPGVYGGLADMIPLGSVVSKALTIKAGQTHVQRYMRPLLERIEAGEIDPTFVITHRGSLEQAPELYRTFRDKEDGCIKVVLKPFDGSPPA